MSWIESVAFLAVACLRTAKFPGFSLWQSPAKGLMYFSQCLFNFANAWCQAVRITKPKWITAHISVSIQPTIQPNRITFDVASSRRIIVPEVVVAQAAVAVVLLAGEAQWHVEDDAVAIHITIHCTYAKGVAVPAPQQLLAGAGGLAWGVEVIAVQVVLLGAGDCGAVAGELLLNPR